MNEDTLGNKWTGSNNHFILFDKVINLYFFKEAEQTYQANVQIGQEEFAIITPVTGPKPDIDISFNALDGGIVYGMTVTVRNLELPLTTANLREYTSIIVQAGYRTQHNDYGFVTLRCPIFASYKSEPGPDSSTVFQCVVVGSLQNIFDDTPIDIGFYEKVSLSTFLTDVISAFGGTPHLFIEGAFANAVVDIPHRVYSHANGYAAFNWLQMLLNNMVYNFNYDRSADVKRECRIQLFLFDKDVYVVQLNAIANDPMFQQSDLRVFQIEAVNSVSYNGGTVTVKAPWIPGIRAGHIFRLNQGLYTGNNLVNELKESVYMSKYDCYWVIKMSVSFGTYEQNEMELLAIPIENSNFIGEQNKIRQDAEQKYTSIMNMYKSADTVAHKEISFGTAPQNPVKEESSTEQQAQGGDVFQEDVKISGIDYVIKKGDNLTILARRFYADMPNYRNNKVADKRGGIPKDGYGPGMFWPLIVVATNTKIKDMVAGGQNESVVRRTYDINKEDPYMIKEGKHLIIPSLSGSLKNYKQYHAVFTKMGEYYKDKRSSYSLSLSQIGEMLEGEE